MNLILFNIDRFFQLHGTYRKPSKQDRGATQFCVFFNVSNLSKTFWTELIFTIKVLQIDYTFIFMTSSLCICNVCHLKPPLLLNSCRGYPNRARQDMTGWVGFGQIFIDQKRKKTLFVIHTVYGEICPPAFNPSPRSSRQPACSTRETIWVQHLSGGYKMQTAGAGN